MYRYLTSSDDVETGEPIHANSYKVSSNLSTQIKSEFLLQLQETSPFTLIHCLPSKSHAPLISFIASLSSSVAQLSNSSPPDFRSPTHSPQASIQESWLNAPFKTKMIFHSHSPSRMLTVRLTFLRPPRSRIILPLQRNPLSMNHVKLSVRKTSFSIIQKITKMQIVIMIAVVNVHYFNDGFYLGIGLVSLHKLRIESSAQFCRQAAQDS